MADDLWETNAGWWIEGFTDGADPEYEEQILPLAAEHLSGARRVLDVGCGDGQVARLARRLGAEVVAGVDPTWNQITVAAARGGGPSYARADAAALPFADGSFDAVVACLVFEHIRSVDEAIAEVARVLRAGGSFLFFLNHPLLQTPGSGWIDDQVLDPPGAVLAHRPLPGGGRVGRGGGEGRLHPLHPPAAQPVRQRAGGPRPRRGPHGGAGAAAPASWPGLPSTRTPPASPACCCSACSKQG